MKSENDLINVLKELGEEKVPDLFREIHVVSMVMGAYLTPAKSSIGEMLSSISFHCARLIQEIDPKLIKIQEGIAKNLLQKLGELLKQVPAAKEGAQ